MAVGFAWPTAGLWEPAYNNVLDSEPREPVWEALGQVGNAINSWERVGILLKFSGRNLASQNIHC
jgi:hypothetical protein